MKSLQSELRTEKDEDNKQVIKTRFQELENIIKRLEEELSTEKSDKDVCVEEAGKMCDQMNEHLGVLKVLVENLSPYKNHVTSDRIPNGLEFNDTLASCHDHATSHGEPIHSEFEGKISVDELTLQAILATDRSDPIGGGGVGGREECVLRVVRQEPWNAVPFEAF